MGQIDQPISVHSRGRHLRHVREACPQRCGANEETGHTSLLRVGDLRRRFKIAKRIFGHGLRLGQGKCRFKQLSADNVLSMTKAVSGAFSF